MKTITIINLGEAVIEDEDYELVRRFNWFMTEDHRLATYIMDEMFLMSQVALFPEIVATYARNNQSGRR